MRASALIVTQVVTPARWATVAAGSIHIVELTGWHRHFGPASGSDPKVRDTLGRYVTTTYAYGTNLGPAEVARHMRGKVSAHEIYTAGKYRADLGCRGG